jgi:GH15 family glucan-1,4-alpha-glucosidase
VTAAEPPKALAGPRPDAPFRQRGTYRYGWVRDSAMIARALSLATCADEACRYFEWITPAAVTCRDDDHVQVVFGVGGERDISEHALDHLRGHLNSRPVRVGNDAFRQRQLDVLGELVDCAWIVRNQLEAFDPFTAEFLCELVDRAAQQWREPDSGIWEGREGERHYLFSKLMCWVALDRGIRLADQLGAGADVRRWREVRQDIADAVLQRGWCASQQAFSGSFDSDHLDAAVLAMPIAGLVEPDDRRMRQTIDAVERELGDNGLLRRWTGAEDGAFVLVSFWLAECHALGGRLDRAEAVFEHACAHANDLGLFAEEVDPDTHRPLGNFPQAIAHIGLVNAAQTITDARRRARGRTAP